MKRRTIVAGSLFFACGLANAQSSVTLYGVIDAGVLYQSKDGGPKNGGHTSKSTYIFMSSGDAWNRFGMRGIEDLGGGIRAGFQLEGEFNAGNGALSPAGTIFGHYANVFVDSGYGKVTIGKQIDPAYLAFAATDPREIRNAFSGAAWWSVLNGTNPAPSSTLYENNAVSYGYKGHDVSVGVLYGFGNVAGSTAAGQTISAGLSYDNKSLILDAAYLQKNSVQGGRDLRTWSAGIGYRFGPVTLKAAYTDFYQPLGNNLAVFAPTPRSDIRVADVGVSWRVNPSNYLILAYYFAEDRLNTANATSSIVLSEDYLLSKSTKLYGFVGAMNAKAKATPMTSLMTSSLTAGVPNSTAVAVGVGIQTRF